MSDNKTKARLLRPDNFTPLARTPWGGRKIRERYKRALGMADGDAVGESWEVSVEPSFPSRTLDGTPLSALIEADRRAWLGAADDMPLLVKLLDAAQNLSVQVHPADGDPALAAAESGKPEAWIVLEADDGAGLYLGFREGVTQRAVEACIGQGGALDALMDFVPVAPGDAFVIEAGTAHAIGAGVTLLEPQLVTQGKRGVTYRFWDWNRLYEGKPRQLHLERSLAVTNWNARASHCRQASRRIDEIRARVIDWPWFVVDRWQGDAESIIDSDGFVALTCVGGKVSIDGVEVPAGQSAAIPACADKRIHLSGADVFTVSRPMPAT